jgi:hypothetical protein
MYLFILSMCLLLVKEHVFAVNSEDSISYSNFENIFCSDVFENDQCKFIEMTLKFSINNLYQNVMENDILNSQREKIVIKEQIK